MSHFYNVLYDEAIIPIRKKLYNPFKIIYYKKIKNIKTKEKIRKIYKHSRVEWPIKIFYLNLNFLVLEFPNNLTELRFSNSP